MRAQQYYVIFYSCVMLSSLSLSPVHRGFSSGLNIHVLRMCKWCDREKWIECYGSFNGYRRTENCSIGYLIFFSRSFSVRGLGRGRVGWQRTCVSNIHLYFVYNIHTTIDDRRWWRMSYVIRVRTHKRYHNLCQNGLFLSLVLFDVYLFLFRIDSTKSFQTERKGCGRRIAVANTLPRQYDKDVLWWNQ